MSSIISFVHYNVEFDQIVCRESKNKLASCLNEDIADPVHIDVEAEQNSVPASVPAESESAIEPNGPYCVLNIKSSESMKIKIKVLYSTSNFSLPG